MWYIQKIRNMCFATSVSCIFSWFCGLFWEPFFPAESNYGNPKSEGSTRLVDSYDLCFFPFATSHPFREETRGKSPGLHQVGSIRYQASGSVIAIRPYGKISRSQPGNWKKGSNLSFTQLFLIFGVRLIEVSYICIVVFILFWSSCCSNSVDIPKRITSFFWSAQTWFGKPLKCHTSGSLACLWLFLCRTTHRPNHHSCTPATVNANKSPCSVTVSWCDMLEFMITKFLCGLETGFWFYINWLLFHALPPTIMELKNIIFVPTRLVSCTIGPFSTSVVGGRV